MSDDEEVFCVYCQKEYTSEGRFRRHVLTMHPGTYKANTIERSSTQQTHKENTDEQ